METLKLAICSWLCVTVSQAIPLTDNGTLVAKSLGAMTEQHTSFWGYNPLNFAHYYMPRVGDETDEGSVQRVYYHKQSDTSHIRVQWYGTLRGSLNAHGCGRWRILFNGSDCTDPGRIEYIDRMEASTNTHRASEIDGICYGLPMGIVEIRLYAGPCPGFVVKDLNTGWHNTRHMFVYELQRSPNNGRGLSLFNEHQNASVLEIKKDDHGHGLQVLQFVKTDDDTGIYVQFNGAMGNLLRGNTEKCARWYITFNNTECESPGSIEGILAILDNPQPHFNQHRHYSIHGICYNIPRGNVAIELRTGRCPSTTTIVESDTYTGWNSMSRIMAQEVRMGIRTNTGLLEGGLTIPATFFNIAHHWMFTSISINGGVLKTVTFNKTRSESGLKLVWMGDHRIKHNSARWFFTVDNKECGAASDYGGPVEGWNYQNPASNYHQPAVVSGICYGIQPGLRTIGYNVYSAGHDAYTGWESASQLIIMEVNVTSFTHCRDRLHCITTRF